MIIDIKISESLTQLEQMAHHLGIKVKNNEIIIPPKLGTGFCRLIQLPYQIQLHHYQYCLNQQIIVQSENNVEDGMYILNFNLSDKLLDKNIGTTQHWLSKGGNHGVLFYSPGNHSKGANEIDLPYEVIFFSIPKSTMDHFLDNSPSQIIRNDHPFCRYAEIENVIAEDLLNFISPKTAMNSFVRQGKTLAILGSILQTFLTENWEVESSGLKMRDIEVLLKVKGILNDHIFGTAPTINELAKNIGVSPTKLKSNFKSLFGLPIYQFYLKKKLNIAHQLLTKREGTIAEIGYKLGYNNISQFSAQFKKQFGILPSQVQN